VIVDLNDREEQLVACVGGAQADARWERAESVVFTLKKALPGILFFSLLPKKSHHL
jgi:hypothetical protein